MKNSKLIHALSKLPPDAQILSASLDHFNDRLVYTPLVEIEVKKEIKDGVETTYIYL